jgi:hypothetical protein
MLHGVNEYCVGSMVIITFLGQHRRLVILGIKYDAAQCCTFCSTLGLETGGLEKKSKALVERQRTQLQDGSKSVSPLTLRDSFSNPLLKQTIPITVTLPLTPFLGSILVQL